MNALWQKICVVEDLNEIYTIYNELILLTSEILTSGRNITDLRTWTGFSHALFSGGTVRISAMISVPNPVGSSKTSELRVHRKIPEFRMSEIRVDGASGRARTADKVINSHLLYRLSY